MNKKPFWFVFPFEYIPAHVVCEIHAATRFFVELDVTARLDSQVLGRAHFPLQRLATSHGQAKAQLFLSLDS